MYRHQVLDEIDHTLHPEYTALLARAWSAIASDLRASREIYDMYNQWRQMWINRFSTEVRVPVNEPHRSPRRRPGNLGGSVSLHPVILSPRAMTILADLVHRLGLNIFAEEPQPPVPAPATQRRRVLAPPVRPGRRA